MPKRLLVTGASGLLGSNLVLTAISLGHTVFPVSHSCKLNLENAREVDLTVKQNVRDIVNQVNPDWIVHCAALTNLEFCEQHPEEAERINVQMTSNLAQAAKKHNLKFLYISTDSVFDGKEGNYSEDDTPHPLNVYARTKLEGERTATQVKQALIVRTNLFGFNAQNKSSLAEWMLEQLRKGESFTGFTDVIFSPLFVNDLAKLIVEMVEGDFFGVVHLGSSDVCSKFDFACQLGECFGLDRTLIHQGQTADAPFKAMRPKNTSLNTSRAEKMLGHPMPSIKSGLQQLRILCDSGFRERLKSLVRG